MDNDIAINTKATRSRSIDLTPEDTERLEKVTRARTSQVQEVTRAKILLLRAQGHTLDSIATEVGVNRNSVELCVKKYTEGGIKNALADASGRGRKAVITDHDKTWVINIACQKPTDFGYAAELWTYDKLASHIRSNATKEGHPNLARVSKSKVFRILEEEDIKPHRVRYYCEKRDPDLDAKMHNVLLVYKQLQYERDQHGQLLNDEGHPIHVLSFDEKPGIQAISNTAEDRRPTKEHGTVQRDYEYKRLGVISLLAGIDLQTGEAIPLVSKTHNSADYIQFLQILDEKYPRGHIIRLVLDNLSVHTSTQTKAYLESVPGRFEFVFTPKHGSWLNMIEGSCSKMTKQMLRGIRVKTVDELYQRIYQYFREVNEEPVVFHWKYDLDDIDVTEAVKVERYQN